MGQFVDSTDGVTPETGVTLAGADQAEVLKANGAATTAMAGTFAAVTGADGWYDYTVAVGDVDTVGEVVFIVQDSSVCLPVFVRAQVVEEAVFDALFAASAAGFASISALATVDANVDAILVDTSTTLDGKINTIDTNVDSILVDTAEIGAAGAGLTALATAANLATVDTNVDSILVDTATTIPAQITALNDFNPATDTVANVTTVATTTTNTDMRGTDSAATSSALAVVDGNVDSILVDTATTIPAQISGLNDISTAQVNAEVDTALSDIHLDHLFATDYDPASPPGTTTALLNELIESDAGVSRFTANSLEQAPSGGGGGGGASASAIADAVWDELQSGHVAVGSMGEIATEIASILADTGTAIPSQISGLNDLSAAQVNTEVDTALADYDGPTNAEMVARTLPSASYFDPATDPVSNVTTVATTITNTDMRGTDSAATASALATAQSDLDIITGATGVNLLAATQASIDAIEVDTGTTLPGLIDDLAIKKNAVFPNFEFLMVLTSDHYTPATGLTVTGQRSIDGGAFASISGTIAEVSNGIYQFDALAADTNGDVITWRFSSATADDTFITFKTVQ